MKSHPEFQNSILRNNDKLKSKRQATTLKFTEKNLTGING